MKTTAVFQQSNHLPVQHDQSGLQLNTNAFNQQLQQHLIPTQVQQQQQLQQAQQQHRGQHVQQLHRLSQSHMASIHSGQPMVSAGANQQTSTVFPNADFFQTLQQTAAAALPTVLPYDQSQYIGQLMYFPYPTAATNGLFGATANPDSSQQSTQHHHHMTATLCTSNRQPANNTQPTSSLIDQSSVTTSVTSGNSGCSRIISAATSGAAVITGQQLTSTSHIPGCAPTAACVSTSQASLSPLFTTAQFYHHQQQASIVNSQQQQQAHIQQLHHHNLQQQQPTHHLQSLPLPLAQHSQQPPLHSIAMIPHHVGQQQQPSATLLLSSPLQPASTPSTAAITSNIVLSTSGSNMPAAAVVAVSQPHVPHHQSVPAVSHRHITPAIPDSSDDGGGKSTTSCTSNINNGNAATINNHCDGQDGGEEEVADDSSQHPIHSTPNHTPVKQQQPVIDPGDNAGINKTENANMTRMNKAGNHSNGSNTMEITPVSIKRDNTGTGHFVCGVCGREFGMRCRLIAHTRRHTGERPFPCADCGRAFSDRGNLQRHRYTHSSQPRFHCSVCGKLFRQASCLSNHRRFHCAGATGRPCPFCQRSFRSSSSLQMHIRWKHRADAAAAVAAATAAAAAVAVSSCGGGIGLGGCLPGSGDLASPANASRSSGSANPDFGCAPMLIGGGGQQLQAYPCVSYSSVHGGTVNGAVDSSNLLRAAAAVAASAGVSNNFTTTTSTMVTSGGQLCLPVGVQQVAGLPHNFLFDQLTFPYEVTGMGSGTTVCSPNKRKWRRKSKPKQQPESYTFGKLTNDGLNLLAGFQLTDGTGLSAAMAGSGTPIDMNAAMAVAAAMGGTVPLDRKGRPCNFSCPACPRRFAFQCRLAAHIRCHTNIRPFICIDCGRAFTQRGYLVRHAAVHKLDRPFSCALCDRSYKHYGSLVNHRRTHGKPSVLNTMSLLSASGAHLAQCDPGVSGVGTISCLEEVVGGSLTGTKLTDNDLRGEIGGGGGESGCGRTTTITLLPISKMEEVLPGDPMGGGTTSNRSSTGADGGAASESRQQSGDSATAAAAAVHSSNNVVSLPASVVDQHVAAVAIPPISSLPHQLTATAVWPILAGSGVGPGTGVPQSMIGASHFPTLTLSNHLGQVAMGSAANPGGAAASALVSNHYLQRTAQQHVTPILSSSSSAAPSTSTYVTVPIFGGGTSQQVSTATSGGVDSSTAEAVSVAAVPTVVVSTSVGCSGGATTAAPVNAPPHSGHHHPFDLGLAGGTVTTSSVSGLQAATQQQPQHMSHRSAAGVQHPTQLVPTQLPQQQQSSTPGGGLMTAASTAAGDVATASSAPVLHVLQPSPSIFFSPYYLPHTATSQM